MTVKGDAPSAGFGNPKIRITSKHFEPSDDDGNGGTWAVSAVIEAEDGTRTTNERFSDLPKDADDGDIEAAVAERWGIE